MAEITKGQLIAFIMGATKKAPKGEAIEFKSLKSAPHYFEEIIPRQYLVSSEKRVWEKGGFAGREVEFLIKMYAPDILIVEAVCDLPNVFDDKVIVFTDELIDECYRIFEKRRGIKETTEEYSIITVSGYSGEPEKFFEIGDKIAGFLKSENLPLDKKEIELTLNTSLKYAKNDLVIVDWDGAFVFDQEGDFASTVELLELANFQLLRYRILDSFLDNRLHRAAETLKNNRQKTFFFGSKEVKNTLRYLIEIRATSLSEFLSLERDIKLIGDWYSARLYDLTGNKFKFAEWRMQIKDKLETLQNIYAVAEKQFSLSTERINMIGWFVLLFGWMVILGFDLYFTLTGRK